jgi:uncharacterized protein DUF6161
MTKDKKMADVKEAVNFKRITIKTETGTKWFDDPDKLITWIQEQRTLYDFHSNFIQSLGVRPLIQKFDQSWNHLQQFVQNLSRFFSNDAENYNENVEEWSKQFHHYLSSRDIFTSEAPFAAFIERQSAIKPEYGIAAIAVIFESNLVVPDRFTLDGVKQAEEYLAGNSDRIDDESETLEQLRARWDQELTSHRDNWVNDFEQETNVAKSHNQNISVLIDKWNIQKQEHVKQLDDQVESFTEKFDKTYQDAKDNLERLTKTYDEKLALHAAVRYWGIQKKLHHDKVVGYGIALGIIVVLVVVGLVLFSTSILDQTLQDIKISRLFTAAILTTFGVWIVKIFANIFMSHMHLETDAQERRTMIHTYLALTRKGQGPKEDERQLILQTLFRPSADGMIKGDAGPAHLVDLINRITPKVRD